MSTGEFSNKVLNVAFFKEENKLGFSIYDYAKKYNWSSDLDKEDCIENYFFTKDSLKFCNSFVLVSGGCFGEEFETRDSIFFLLSSKVKVIIAERFSLSFLELVEDMDVDIILITLFRDTLYSKILYRLISRKDTKFLNEIDENFKIRLFFDKGYDYTKNLSIQVYTNHFVRFESFQVGKLKKNFLCLK